VRGGVGISVVCVRVLIVISVGCLTVSAVGAVSSYCSVHGCIVVSVVCADNGICVGV